MFPAISGKPVHVKCEERAFPEFPDMLFGKANENGDVFFDATEYLKTQHSTATVPDFFKKYGEPVRQLASVLGISDDRICRLNHEGHHLIDSSFVYLFISFTDNGFIAYVCDRLSELFSAGFCVSDSYILHAAKNRLTGDVLQAMSGNGDD